MWDDDAAPRGPRRLLDSFSYSYSHSHSYSYTLNFGEVCDFRPSYDLDLAPNGTTNWGTCRGRCVSGLSKFLPSIDSPASCWDACVSLYGDDVVAIEWRYDGFCSCQDSCKSVEAVGDPLIYLITRDSAVDELPETCAPDPESEDFYATPIGTRNWGLGYGYCDNELKFQIADCAPTPAVCYELCLEEFGDRLAAIKWDDGICHCADSCKCMEDPGEGFYTITRNSKVPKLPPLCRPATVFSDDKSSRRQRRRTRLCDGPRKSYCPRTRLQARHQCAKTPTHSRQAWFQAWERSLVKDPRLERLPAQIRLRWRAGACWVFRSCWAPAGVDVAGEPTRAPESTERSGVTPPRLETSARYPFPEFLTLFVSDSLSKTRRRSAASARNRLDTESLASSAARASKINFYRPSPRENPDES